MSHPLINRSTDLKALRDKGYGVEFRLGGYLVVHKIAYLNSKKEPAFGTLIVKLHLATDEQLLEPNDHVAYFAGEMPCDVSGVPMEHLAANHSVVEMAGIAVQHTLSRHPVGRQYKDYYELVTTYDDLINLPAWQVAAVTSKSFPFIESVEEESVFHYTDTASSRAEIDSITRKLAIGKVAVVGGGGTGSYVVDLVAKTPVSEIHIFDGDRLFQHNAFRAPGAATKDELKAQILKVDYLYNRYSNMHRRIVKHAYFVTETNVDELREMQFVFLCVDETKSKRMVIDKLEEFGVPFVDVGMGINIVAGKLTGMLRTVLSTPANRAVARENIPLEGGEVEDEYATNIQIADLNAMNAALAVMKWKKTLGFYADVAKESCSLFQLSSNFIVNTDSL